MLEASAEQENICKTNKAHEMRIVQRFQQLLEQVAALTGNKMPCSQETKHTQMENEKNQSHMTNIILIKAVPCFVQQK